MKTLIVIALIAIASADFVGLQEEIDHINSIQSDWVAAPNQYSGLTTTEVQRFLLGAILRPTEKVEDKSAEILKDYITVPSTFDSRDQWTTCMHAVRDQARCGSCWAFSASEVLSDRTCIEGGDNVVLSPQDMVSCDKSNFACQGGYLTKAWSYLASTGIVSDSCYPYTSGSGQVAGCFTSCPGGGQWRKYRAHNYASYYTVDMIKQEVYTNGPIQTGFTVYADFMSYHSGVYRHVTGK
jgi:cathepsin B